MRDNRRSPSSTGEVEVEEMTPSIVPRYHDGIRCPGCMGRNWLIGRLLAECGRCGYALVLGVRD